MNKEKHPESYVNVKSICPNWDTSDFLDFMNLKLEDCTGKNITSIGGGFGIFEMDAAKAGAILTAVDPIFSDENLLNGKLQENISWLDKKTNWESSNLIEKLRSEVAKTLANSRYPDKYAEVQDKLKRYDECKEEIDGYIRKRKQQLNHLKDWKSDQEKHGLILNPSSGDDIQGIENSSQDIVVIAHTLSHIYNKSHGDIVNFLSEASKILKSGGKFYIIDYIREIPGMERILEKTKLKKYYRVNKGSFVCCFDKKGLDKFLENELNLLKYSNESLLTEKQYTKGDILKAALVTHPRSEQINLTEEELKQTLIFEKGSNLTPLKNPIVDEYGNEYRCSEGYYMAQRVDDLGAKKIIAFLSTGFGLAMKARELYDLEQDDEKRIEFMRNAIKEKFDNNPELKEELVKTGDKEIIEYTYRGDTRFGIDQNTLKGKNILGKLLMEYRDNNKKLKVRGI